MMRTKLFTVVALSSVTIFASMALRFLPQSERVASPSDGLKVFVAATNMPRAVHALGRLEPASRVIKVAAPSGSEGNRLETLHVQEGDDVVQGDILGYMDTRARRLAAQGQEEARLSTAIAKLNQVKEGSKPGEIEAARATVEAAERDLATKERERRRAEQLERNHAISDTEVDEHRLAHERAVATLRQTKAQLDAISEVRAVDLALAEAEVRLAQSAVELAQAHVAATCIVAPCDGRVLRIDARPGEQISSDGLLELGQVERMQAVAEVFEGDIPAIEIGNEALISIDTTGHALHGQVREIGHIVARKSVLTNDPVSDTDARVVEVRLDLDQSDFVWLARLSNARVSVRILPHGLMNSPVSVTNVAPGTSDQRDAK